jgi:hypothetical protein
MERMTDKKTWFIVGVDAISLAGRKVANLTEQANVYRGQSISPALDVIQPTKNRR